MDLVQLLTLLLATQAPSHHDTNFALGCHKDISEAWARAINFVSFFIFVVRSASVAIHVPICDLILKKEIHS